MDPARFRLIEHHGESFAFHEGDVALERLQRGRPAGACWVDLSAPTEEALQLLRRLFGFHEIPLEDCLHFDQRPKLEEFPGPDPYVFIVIHNFSSCQRGGPGLVMDLGLPAGVDHSGPTAIRADELHAFLGRSFLVTVHSDGLPALDGVFRRVAGERALFERGPDFVYYLVADALCDSNFPVVEQISDELDDIEEAVLAAPSKTHLHRTYSLRKVLVQMRKVLSPQRDVLAVLLRQGGGACVRPENALYFRDVHDHLVRINESLESGRDLLGNCVDAYLSAVGQRTNEIMKQLTILSAVMLPLSFLAGFFGMNFEQLPYKSDLALAGCLVLMFLVLPGGMILWFYHRRWLGDGR